MDPAIRGAALVICAISAALGGITLRDDLISRAIASKNTSRENSAVDQYARASLDLEDFNRFTKSAESPLISNETLWRIAKTIHAKTDLISDTDNKLAAICSEYRALSRALKGAPKNSRYLIGLANIRQLLGKLSCPGVNLGSDYKVALEAAIQSDPNNPEILFSAGLISLWDQDGNSARRNFNRFLMLGGTPSSSQEESILSSISSVSDLQAVVPAQFPQVVRWTQLLTGKFDGDRELSAALAELQTTALEQSRLNRESGKISSAIYRDRLSELRFLAASDVVRQQIDSELGGLYSQSFDRRLGALFVSLSSMNELASVIGASDGDSRPNRSSLISWGGDQVVSFDSRYQSVGAFVGSKRRAKLFLLAGQAGSIVRDATLIRVLVSSNNSSYTDVSDSCGIFSYQFEARPMIAIDASRIVDGFPYWKINFASGSDDPRLTNSLSELLKIYG